MPKNSPDNIPAPYPEGLSSELQPISWEAFRSTGLLAFVNGFLHIFGLTIVVDELNGVYPARTKWRGFSEKSWTKAYRKLSNYMAMHSEALKSEANED